MARWVLGILCGLGIAALLGCGGGDGSNDFVLDDPEPFLDVGEDALMTFPDLENAGAGAVDLTIEPEWDGADSSDHSLMQIREPHEWGSRMQLTKNGEFLRFVVTDDSGQEAEISFDIRDWDAGQSHRLTATWERGQTKLYVDGRLVGQSTYSGAVDFEPGTPVYIGSDPDDVSGGAESRFTSFKVYEPQPD